ncbi:antibiotic biosynthesis monooxygenase [Cyanobium sp. HWJ4-Hawea]|uniref:putative quinol monooxygenase n=1 Tax=unclassified Cyanobium TaxID=2627006 RepID=UPI0020CEB28F|nr:MULTISPECIES: putative quinol monooxygenase [unclassified Cyanobium]MCP9775919.1 antibiotic biosynthesis monooxygenase [Cyanobium sp. WAJ14-Wanaka]MCP9808742.1 antibiotic biosynthesis monooxygenase [Cyanobium sp. HWJ4-Hawea]
MATRLLALAVVLVMGLWGVQPSLAASNEQVRVVGRLPMQLSTTERQEFEHQTMDLAKITRAEDGVIQYSCNADIEKPGTYVFDEIWPSEQALNDHLNTDHFKQWWAWVEPHLNGDLVINIADTRQFHSVS